MLFDYVDALGKLSAADATGFEKAAPTLGTSFKNTGFDTTQQDMANAAGTLAGAITKLATLGYREKEVADIIQKSQRPVRTLAQGLANQIAPDKVPIDTPCSYAPPAGTPPTYLLELCNEEQTIHSYYDVPLASETDPGLKIILRGQYQTALDQLAAREKAALAYRTFMMGIADAHDKLVTASKAGFDKAAVQNLAKQISEPISGITESVKSLEKDAR
ncbi:hypothetical protein D1Y84_00240 [Acidipila sp. EB88]|nr:hypothetical protein D1Y84_00240 [Acidipila sp. EB88]